MNPHQPITTTGNRSESIEKLQPSKHFDEPTANQASALKSRPYTCSSCREFLQPSALEKRTLSPGTNKACIIYIPRGFPSSLFSAQSVLRTFVYQLYARAATSFAYSQIIGLARIEEPRVMGGRHSTRVKSRGISKGGI